MKPYKVLFFSHDAKLAGAEVALSRVVSALDRTKFSPLVVVPQRGTLETLLTQQNVPYVFVPYFTTMVKELTDSVILKQIAAIQETIAVTAPDLIVINTVTIPHVIIAALTTDIPMLVHIHEFVDKQQFGLLPASNRLFEEMWLQFPETLLAVSGWIAQHYTMLLNREIIVLPNFVVSPVAPTQVMADPNSIPTIVMLGSLADQNKRHDLFISAAATIRENHPTLRFQCEIIGTGAQDDIDRLNQQIDTSHLQDIFAIRSHDELEKIYRSNSLVFVASDVESFSMVVIEAGSYGCPVVATRCGGPNELIVDGETGFLIDVSDSNAAAARLAFLLQNPDVAYRMGQAARLRVETHYSQQSVMPQYEKILEETILQRSYNTVQRRIGSPIARYFAEMAR